METPVHFLGSTPRCSTEMLVSLDQQASKRPVIHPPNGLSFSTDTSRYKATRKRASRPGKKLEIFLVPARWGVSESTAGPFVGMPSEGMGRCEYVSK